MLTFSKRLGWPLLALLILNEIRGLAVVAGVLWAWARAQT